MKRIVSFLLSAILVLSLCGCNMMDGRNLQNSMELPENGIISKGILEELNKEQGVAVFSGQSNGYQYEWTIFGEDVAEPRDLNLGCEIQQSGNDIAVTFLSNENFGFSPVLSIKLIDPWSADNALVYENDKVVCSASVTGEDKSILNFSATVTTGTVILKPDGSAPGLGQGDSTANTSDSTQQETTSTGTVDEYLTAPPSQPGYQISDGSQTGQDEYQPGYQISDGSQTGQDEYLTDPVPEGKPLPIEPGDVAIDTGTQLTCTFSIECSTILNNLADLKPEKLDEVPSNGVILPATTVVFYQGESVFDVLQRLCKEKGIHMESSWTPMYNSAYVEGIHNLYEFDCGNLSGWMYRVDGWYPNYGCSRYLLKAGEVVEWRYTCDLGHDVGCDWLG